MELRVQEGISEAESAMRGLAAFLNSRADILAYGRIYQNLDADGVDETRYAIEQDSESIVEALLYIRDQLGEVDND